MEKEYQCAKCGYKSTDIANFEDKDHKIICVPCLHGAPADTAEAKPTAEQPAPKALAEVQTAPEKPADPPKKQINAIGLQGTSADFENTGNPVDREFSPVLINNQYVMAGLYYKSKCFTKDCENVEQVFIKMQAGRELGLYPLEAMKDLCLIHGQVTFWGTGLVKRFRKFGWKIEYKDEISTFDYKSARGKKKGEYEPHYELNQKRKDESEDQVTVVVTNGEEQYEYKVTLAEVEAMNSNALNIDRKSKLRYHGLARIARHNIPEILGPISYIAEEVTAGFNAPAPSKLDTGKSKKQQLKERQNNQATNEETTKAN